MVTDVVEKKHLISVVLSFRNEEETIPELIRRLHEVLKSLSVDYELIFVNDDSTDNSLPLLIEKANENNRIKVINMARRFGVSECALAGMKYSSGDAIIYMDADLQDPPEVIPQLIEKWLQGADVVYTIRTSRAGESGFRLFLIKVAYRLIQFSSDIDLTPEAGDFRLLSRRIVKELVNLNEKNPYLRGLVSWVGFKQVPVYYQREKRAGGKTHFPLFGNFFRDLLSFRGTMGTFLSGFTSFSILPLIIFLLLGIVICLGTSIALLAAIILKTDISGLFGIMIAIFFMSGIQLLGIGTLGLYLGRIYHDVRNRPHYIVESTIGLGEET